MLEKCPFCESVAEEYYRSKEFVRCASCGLILRSDPGKENNLSDLYKKSWLLPEKNQLETGGTDQILAQVYSGLLLKTLKLNTFHNQRILEFGAGRGYFSDSLVDRGAQVFLYEPYGYEYLVSKGYRVFRNFSEIDTDLHFDGIVSIDVIEHLEEPWNDLRELARYLKPHGWMFLSTPNSGSLNSMISRHEWRELQNPSHLMMFNQTNIESMFQRLNFHSYQKLKWPVNYHRFIIRQWLIFLLQFFGLDGELRYLVRN
jgi:2-polyprenyl-3-methyl-5-hydroxy-6-metoxy-1,4-benzoquinol methylase